MSKKFFFFNFLCIFSSHFFFNAYDFRSVINSNLFLISLKINLYEKKLLKKKEWFYTIFLNLIRNKIRNDSTNILMKFKS
jgi:hypothetical protein